MKITILTIFVTNSYGRSIRPPMQEIHLRPTFSWANFDSNTNCNLVCPKLLDPVCGSDGETYDNECEMGKKSCERNIIITKNYKGPCNLEENDISEDIECPTLCNRMSNPVCGSDGETYSNECMMKLKACERKIIITKTHKGECIKQEKQCFRLCDRMAKPICGSDGQTYGSECMMKVEACEKDVIVTKRYDGSCVPMENDTNESEDGANESENNETCLKPCNRMINEVCGSDNQTYANSCLLEIASCENSFTIRKKHDGACK